MRYRAHAEALDLLAIMINQPLLGLDEIRTRPGATEVPSDDLPPDTGLGGVGSQNLEAVAAEAEAPVLT